MGSVAPSAELKRLRVVARAMEQSLRAARQQDVKKVRQFREKLREAAAMNREGRPARRVMAVLTQAEKLVPYKRPTSH